MASHWNILWIVTTQWRAQSVGYAGDTNAHTPVLDRLAATSLNYVEAVTPHPFGPFARAALLTGIESPGNGVCDYFDPLPTDARTIAHDMRSRGYFTAYFGKWHLGPKDIHAPLVGQSHATCIVPPQYRGGFDFWEGFEGGFQLMNPWLHGSRLPEPKRFSGYQSDVVTARAAEFLSTRRERRWFCVVSLEPPHPPYDDAPATGMTEVGELHLRSNVPQTSAVLERARRELRGYYRHIAATDAAIGRFLQCIDPSDTAIVFTSVHGDMHGSHGLFRKGWPYEESVRVPLLIRVPGMASAATVADAVSLSDLPQLTLQLAEKRTPAVHRAAATISMPSVVGLADQCDCTWRGIRSRDHKLVLKENGVPWLLFDLRGDPHELRNLVEEPGARELIATLGRQIT
jgi:arylsulfatase A-like enzyme